jgi:hypothetical protein
MKPRIFVERQGRDWAVQELDAAPTTLRFRSKAKAEAVGVRVAHRRAGELVVLDREGRIERWESFGPRTSHGRDWIGSDALTA